MKLRATSSILRPQGKVPIHLRFNLVSDHDQARFGAQLHVALMHSR